MNDINKPEEQSVEKRVKKILNDVPRDILELFYSEKLSSKMLDIYKECNITKEEEIEKVAMLLGKMFFGTLPPSNFPEALRKEGFSSSLANEIFFQIDTKILFSIRGSLKELYRKTKNKPRGKMQKAEKEDKEKKQIPPKKPESNFSPKNKPVEDQKPDAYREPIE